MTNPLPTLVIPGHIWRWYNPQGGMPISTTCIQLMGPHSDLSAVATIDRNADGTWRAEGRAHGMAAIIAGNWSRGLTVEECAAAIAAHITPVVAPSRPGLPKHVAALAMALYRDYTRHYAEYEAACEQHRHHGFSPQHCEHGTYLWTAHDPICGSCEDGYTLSTPMARRVEALRVAKRRHAAAKAMLKWASAGSDHGLYTPAFQDAAFARYESLMGVQ